MEIMDQFELDKMRWAPRSTPSKVMNIIGDLSLLILIPSGPAEIVPILLPRRVPPDHAALRSAVHEVCLVEAAPVHPLALRHEAPQPRAHSEHHLVSGPDTQDELQLQRLPPP